MSAVSGVTAVSVELDVMNDEQRREVRKTVRGDADEPVIPFAQPGSLTRVYAVASGKGGVGKSSVTVNLAAAMADRGLSVGVVDADIYGHSVPRMLGTDDRPTKVDDMIMPPQSHGVKVISIGMFTPGNTPVVWRGPMLHRALQQFLADVFWGDLDILLLDLPPGTGDIAISVAQLIPSAELLVVTTPQQAAAEVAERAGRDLAADPPAPRRASSRTCRGWTCPTARAWTCSAPAAARRSPTRWPSPSAATVPLLGQIPIDTRLREGGDAGMPLVLTQPESPAGAALRAVAEKLSVRSRGLAGMSLNISPAGR